LENGVALNDLMSDGYTILNLGDNDRDASLLEHALNDLGAPVRQLKIADVRARTLLEADLFLIRPDLHVVWRGNTLTKTPKDIATISVGQSGRAATAEPRAESLTV
jgi:hypothetical protein